MIPSQGEKIWIVDDDPGILEVVQIILEESGYDARTISSGEELDSIIVAETPALILLDIFISGSDGRDIARKLKSSVKTDKIPIIMMSANMNTAQIARESGVEDYILKPFNIEDLERLVRKHLKKVSSQYAKPRKQIRERN